MSSNQKLDMDPEAGPSFFQNLVKRDDDTEGAENVQPDTKKQKLDTLATASSLSDRLSAFLPKMKDANSKLSSSTAMDPSCESLESESRQPNILIPGLSESSANALSESGSGVLKISERLQNAMEAAIAQQNSKKDGVDAENENGEDDDSDSDESSCSDSASASNADVLLGDDQEEEEHVSMEIGLGLFDVNSEETAQMLASKSDVAVASSNSLAEQDDSSVNAASAASSIPAGLLLGGGNQVNSLSGKKEGPLIMTVGGSDDSDFDSDEE
jgi:hypothetical protein